MAETVIALRVELPPAAFSGATRSAASGAAAGVSPVGTSEGDAASASADSAAAFAAAAITGGDGFKTMMLTARYTLPAFLVPFAFVLTENGQGLLLQGGLETILIAAVVSAVAVAGLAARAIYQALRDP